MTLQQKMAVRVFGEDAERADGRCRFAPEVLVLCINNFCNLKCRMCDVGIGERASVFWANMIGDDPGNISLDLLRQVLDGAQEFRPLPRIGLAFTEPLIHVQILDFCREIKQRGFFCTITPNGFMLPQRAEALADIGVDEITISIDGPAEIHDRIRGRKGSFARLYDGIEKLHAARARTGQATRGYLHNDHRPELRASAGLPGSYRAPAPVDCELRPSKFHHRWDGGGA